MDIDNIVQIVQWALKDSLTELDEGASQQFRGK